MKLDAEGKFELDIQECMLLAEAAALVRKITKVMEDRRPLAPADMQQTYGVQLARMHDAAGILQMTANMSILGTIAKEISAVSDMLNEVCASTEEDPSDNELNSKLH